MRHDLSTTTMPRCQSPAGRHGQARRARAAAAVATTVGLLLSGCSGPGAPRDASADSLDIVAFDTITVLHVEDTARVRAVAPVPARGLSPLADSLSQLMTFLATFQRVFVAAGRAHRLLVDLGRIDARVNTPALAHAYQEAAAALSPVRVGDRFRLHGPWGAGDGVVTGFDVWNGRMVATLTVPPLVDSTLHRRAPVVALAVRADSAAPPVADSCARDSLPAPLAARVRAVRDSLVNLLRADTATVPIPLRRHWRVGASQATGCFRAARVVLITSGSAGGYQAVREIAVLVDSTGRVLPLGVSDLRFKAHEVLRAFDADGDGVDDVAAIGHGPQTGGTVVFRLDPVKRRLTYVMSGFAWERY